MFNCTRWWVLLLSHLGSKNTWPSILWASAYLNWPTWGKKNTTDSRPGLITGKIYEKFSRLVPLGTWLQMVENDWDDLNSWYFCHWTGAKISWFYVNFAVLGYVWNGIIVVVTKDYLSRGSSMWASVSFSAMTLRTHSLLLHMAYMSYIWPNKLKEDRKDHSHPTFYLQCLYLTENVWTSRY